jgi:PhoH-like protein
MFIEQIELFRFRNSHPPWLAVASHASTPKEAQNTTNEQMKMFLTCIGFGSSLLLDLGPDAVASVR